MRGELLPRADAAGAMRVLTTGRSSVAALSNRMCRACWLLPLPVVEDGHSPAWPALDPTRWLCGARIFVDSVPKAAYEFAHRHTNGSVH